MVAFFTWLLGKLGWQAASGAVGIAKDATEIPKNIVETQKAALEVEALRIEKEDRSRLIVAPSYQQTLKHSNTYRKIVERLKSDEPVHEFRLFTIIVLVLIGAGAFGLADLIQKVFQK
jgi:hypothetical protein